MMTDNYETLVKTLTEFGVFDSGNISTNKARLWLKQTESNLDDIVSATSHLSDDATYVERLFNIVHNIQSLPECIVCGQVHQRFMNRNQGYKSHCSMSCTTKDPATQHKKCNTMIERYGVTHALQNKDIKCKQEATSLDRFGTKFASQNDVIKNKITETHTKRYGSTRWYASDEGKEHISKVMQERYGVEHALQNDQLKTKCKDTIQERYGVDSFVESDMFKTTTKNIMQERYGVDYYTETDEFKQKSKKTMQERYGVDYYMQSNSFIEKTKSTMLKKYNSVNPSHNNDINKKRMQTCMDRYSVEYVTQSAQVKDKVVESNNKKYGYNNYSQIHIPKHIIQKLDNADWLKDQYCNQNKPLIQIGNELGVYYGIVGDRLRKLDVDVRQHSTSYPELQLRSLFEELEIDIITNDRTVIAPKELDIVLPSLNIALEFNGTYWHSSVFNRVDSQYHLNKQQLCQESGVDLISIFESDWNEDTNFIVSKIIHTIYPTTIVVTDINVNMINEHMTVSVEVEEDKLSYSYRIDDGCIVSLIDNTNQILDNTFFLACEFIQDIVEKPLVLEVDNRWMPDVTICIGHGFRVIDQLPPTKYNTIRDKMVPFVDDNIPTIHDCGRTIMNRSYKNAN